MIRSGILTIIACLTFFQAYAQDTLRHNPPQSEPVLSIQAHGGSKSMKLSGLCLQAFENGISVIVFDSSQDPVENVQVRFYLISQPSGTEGIILDPDYVLSDSNGIATAQFTPGSKPGKYIVSCSLQEGSNHESVIFTIDARKRNWVYMLIIGLLGGLGLFLFGMHAMSDGMQKSAGQRMRSILSNVTRNRIVGTGIGTFVTMVIQSSSATSVMLVSFVNAQLIVFRQTIPVLLGAAIGTTITAQLIAFKITEYSLLLVAIGFFLQAFSKKEQLKSIGYTLFGFGVLFFGMHIMSDAMYPLREWPPFINLLITLENPFMGILVGTLFTALIQSSSAFMGIVIVLASQGLITLETSIPLILGTNLGSSVTALLSSLKSSRESKKVAIAFIVIKMISVLIFAWWIGTYSGLIEKISGTASTQRMIANAHTIVNLVLTIVVLPFTNLLARFIDRIMGPEKEEKIKTFKPLYIDPTIVHTPSLALSLAKQEIMRMGNLVRSMFDNILEPFLNKEPQNLNLIYENEKEVNFLRDTIKDFLLKISQEAVSSQRINESFQMLYSLNEFEKIGDIISGSLANRAEKWIAFNYDFSETGKEELIQYHKKIEKQLKRSLIVFEETNLQKAALMKTKHKQYRALSIDLEKQHYSRLMEGLKESLESSKTHLEVLALMSSIDSHATNIARIALEWQEQ